MSIRIVNKKFLGLLLSLALVAPNAQSLEWSTYPQVKTRLATGVFTSEAIIPILDFTLYSILPVDAAVKHQVSAVYTFPFDPERGRPPKLNAAELVNNVDTDFSPGYMALETPQINDRQLRIYEPTYFHLRGHAPTALAQELQNYFYTVTVGIYDEDIPRKSIIQNIGMRLITHDENFQQPPLFVVSKNPTLDEEGIGMATFFSPVHNRQIVVASSRWIRDELEIRRTAESPAILLASSDRLRMLLLHELNHEFQPFHMGWLTHRDEAGTIAWSNLASEKFILTPDAQIMVNTAPPSIHLEWLYGPDGLEMQAAKKTGSVPDKVGITRQYLKHEYTDVPNHQPGEPLPPLRVPPSRAMIESVINQYPEYGHPVLRRIIDIEPIIPIVPGLPPEKEKKAIYGHYLPLLMPMHIVAAFDAAIFAAVNWPIAPFIATRVMLAQAAWLNTLPLSLHTQAGIISRKHVSFVGGYGIESLLNLAAVPDIVYIGVPVENPHALEDARFSSCYNIGTYVLRTIYQFYNNSTPDVNLPDDLLLLTVTGPRGSGVTVDLPQNVWVRENMTRAAKRLNKDVRTLRVSAMLIRKRQRQMIEDTLNVLEIRFEDIPRELQRFFTIVHTNKESYIRLSDAAGFQKYVQNEERGRVRLANSLGGSVILVSDGVILSDISLRELVLDDPRADIAMNVKRAAAAHISSRLGYEKLDGSAVVISDLSLDEDHLDAYQAIDPRARILQQGRKMSTGEIINEAEIAMKAKLPIGPYSPPGKSFLTRVFSNKKEICVSRTYSLDDLAGGASNLTLATMPKGTPARTPDKNSEVKQPFVPGESDDIPGFRELQVIEGGKKVRAPVFAVFPWGEISILPVIFDTGLSELLEGLEQTQELTEGRAAMLLKIVSLFIDLRDLAKAREYIEQVHPRTESQFHQREGMRAYIDGLESVLWDSPSQERAQQHFTTSQEHGFSPASMMQLAVSHGDQKYLTRHLLTMDLLNAVLDGMAKAVKSKDGKSLPPRNIGEDISISPPQAESTAVRLFTFLAQMDHTGFTNDERLASWIYHTLLDGLKNPSFGDTLQDLLIRCMYYIPEKVSKPFATVARRVLENHQRTLGSTVAVTIRMGRASIDVELIDQHGVTQNPKYTMIILWDAYRSLEPKQFVARLAQQTADFLKNQNVPVQHVQSLGVSFWGAVLPNGNVNGFQFHNFPFAKEFQSAFQNIHGEMNALKSKQVQVLDSDTSSLMGERLDKRGLLSRKQDALVLIWDYDGLGGVEVKGEKVIPGPLGYRFYHLKPDTEDAQGFEFWTLEELREQKLLIGSEFQKPRYGDAFAETRLGGAYIATEFANRLDRFHLLGDLAKAIGVSEHDVGELIRVQWQVKDMTQWRAHINPITLRKVLHYLMTSDGAGDIGNVCWMYREGIYDELNYALIRWRRMNSHGLILLGGNLIDDSRNNHDFHLDPMVLNAGAWHEHNFEFSMLGDSRPSAAFRPKIIDPPGPEVRVPPRINTGA